MEITGTADLIQNNFSQKSIEQMLRKHMGLGVQRETKKPEQLLKEATVYNEDGEVAMSPVCFKKAMLSAAGMVKLKKTDLRTSIFVAGNSIPIQYEKMIPRMDITRTAGIGRTPDIRFRPSFRNWKARMILIYSDTIGVQTVIDLLNRSGQGGVGEWRPQKDGVFGTYKVTRHISAAKEIAEVELACASPLKAAVIPPWAMGLEIDPSVADKILNGEPQAVEA